MVSSGERAVLYSFIAKNRVGYKSEGNEGGWDLANSQLTHGSFPSRLERQSSPVLPFLSTAVLALIVASLLAPFVAP